ncbi:tRNA (guanosine(37)-N1)-methyltransferase TrmD [Patescibacteria group bacterium]|nr:tRNA (guanosine(37)-N1)-methyltransferase TrmD [Patescibacteria group bacterium]
MRFNIITIFPDIIDSYTNESILKRAKEKNLIEVNAINLRDFTEDKHKTTDDAPYGGGPGMVMKVEPICKAIQHVRAGVKAQDFASRQAVILLSPQGATFTQKKAQEFSKLEEITFICGRYEGFDARVSEFVDEEISIGNYVLSGGELPALVITEAVSRLIPGVLGDQESSVEETFSKSDNYIEYPHYTRPEVFEVDEKKYSVPEILLSGDHEKIKKWREKNAQKKKE